MTNNNKIVDSWLVLQYQSGRSKAMTLLVKRWHRKLCRHAYGYTKDMDIAKDIGQDCWGVIIKKMHTLKDPGCFGSWALSIATRKSIDWLRKTKRETKNLQLYYDDHNTISNDIDTIDTGNELIILKKMIEKLPHEQQVVLQLFYLEEFSIKQISGIIDVSIGTVKSRLFNAREKLKVTLKNRNHEK